MTNWTMELLERVLRASEGVDDYIHTVADAFERYRMSGRPIDEQILQRTTKAYLRLFEEE